MRVDYSFESINFIIDVDAENRARLIHFSPLEFFEKDFLENKYHTLIELHCLGEDINDHHGSRNTYMCPGTDLKYVDHSITDTENGVLMQIRLSNEKLEVKQYYRFYKGCSVLKCWNTITNISAESQTILYDSSFAFYGLCDANDNAWSDELYSYIPHNSWHGEAQCVKQSFREMGINNLPRGSIKKIALSSVGGWSSGEYIPMGIIENKRTDISHFWQLEHNGSWYCELSAVRDGGPYIQLGGPNFDNHHFKKTLYKGETFESIPVAVGSCVGGFDASVAELVKYRRIIRRENKDNEELPVIFNDYMNCLMGDPTEENELPMIDAAAEIGCEYYVIDAGWFMGIIENKRTDISHFWQLEHNGSWYCELSAVRDGGPYIQLGGPNFDNHHFKKTLYKGETFESIPVAVGSCVGGFDASVAELVKYRRIIRRENKDNEELPVIFNDYMNCLMGDPTEENELPMIDAAAEIGCEYYVIDAGWFIEEEGNDDDWWSILGEYEEAKSRFPNGLKFVIDYIRLKGMIPGLWLELESIGALSDLAQTAPDSWFFQHGGQRVRQHNRYQLDFRNPEVRERADKIVDKLVKYYGCGYIKLDYNINSGLGTDYECESLGLGLLEHNRAYLNWLDSVIVRYPDLIIENCASGGQRMDYACLSRLSLQSISDQTDIKRLAAITSMVSMALTPEQMAIWSYPDNDSSEEETILNMANVMLGRIHQSGFLHTHKVENIERIKEGIVCYKKIRNDIKGAIPFYPLGLINIDSPWNVSALRCENKVYVTVIRKSETENVEIPISNIFGDVKINCIYPLNVETDAFWNDTDGKFCVRLNEINTARIFCIEF